jgi:hypothetical protein
MSSETETLMFPDYVRQRRRTESAAGNLVEDLILDAKLPSMKTWAELSDYLSRNGADDDQLKAAQKVWRGYIAARDKVQRVGAFTL